MNWEMIWLVTLKIENALYKLFTCFHNTRLKSLCAATENQQM